ncbi:sulfurtransferase TusA family protein [Phaeovibrio sulfidiphilus]|uniref:Sulfurtransferase TusA family protein n=1 Tax=Phaeovibrio sulfidiphilus TaxID=1220600 RepID=A0A8J7CWQ3_9PROT|nr:sulfurtransferase TusA family protein [Phaeovibrio sulfidiphilus]
MADTATATARTLDVSGLLCPLPVLRAAKVLRSLAPSDTLEILASDPRTWEDIPALCARAGHTLHDRVREGERRFRYRVRAGTRPDPS